MMVVYTFCVLFSAHQILIIQILITPFFQVSEIVFFSLFCSFHLAYLIFLAFPSIPYESKMKQEKQMKFTVEALSAFPLSVPFSTTPHPWRSGGYQARPVVRGQDDFPELFDASDASGWWDFPAAQIAAQAGIMTQPLNSGPPFPQL